MLPHQWYRIIKVLVLKANHKGKLLQLPSLLHYFVSMYHSYLLIAHCFPYILSNMFRFHLKILDLGPLHHNLLLDFTILSSVVSSMVSSMAGIELEIIINNLFILINIIDDFIVDWSFKLIDIWNSTIQFQSFHSIFKIFNLTSIIICSNIDLHRFCICSFS